MSDETTTIDEGLEPGELVPYERFQAVSHARREAEAEVQKLRGMLKDPNSYDQLTAQRNAAQQQIADLRQQLEQVVPVLSQVEQLSEQLAAERNERQTVEVLAANGIGDAELRDLVRWSYERLPAEGRPAFGDAVAAWRNDPDAAPIALRPHLRAPQPALPNSNAGAVRPPEANNVLNAGAMDLDQWRQHREAIMRTLNKG